MNPKYLTDAECHDLLYPWPDRSLDMVRAIYAKGYEEGAADAEREDIAMRKLLDDLGFKVEVGHSSGIKVEPPFFPRMGPGMERQ